MRAQTLLTKFCSAMLALSMFTFVPTQHDGARAAQLEVPSTFKLEWMRGLVLEDDREGARVMVGNKAIKTGSIFTLVNEQKVSSASDLIAKINAAEVKDLRVTSVFREVEILKNQPVFYYDAWAEGLVLADLPGGALILASAYPNEVGKRLSAINDQPITSAEQAHDYLLQLVNGKIEYRSRSTSTLTPDQTEAARPLLAAQARAEVIPYREQWGALAFLPGKSWFCNGENPGQWLQRRHTPASGNRSVTVARMTSARWLEPGRVLEVMTQQGNSRWVDRISLLEDGSFRLTTIGLASATPLSGRKLADGSVIFPIGSSSDALGVRYHSLLFTGLPQRPNMSLGIGFEPGEQSMSTMCDMEEYTDIRAPRLARNLDYSRQQSAERIEGDRRTQEQLDRLNTEGAAMLANMQASAMAEWTKIPAVIAETNARRAELNEMRRAAENPASGRSSTSPSSPSTGPSSGGGGRRPVSWFPIFGQRGLRGLQPLCPI